MTLFRSSIVILFFAIELVIIRRQDAKVYTFDDYYEAIVKGKAKLDGEHPSNETFNRTDPWEYYVHGFEKMGREIDDRLNKSRTLTFLSAKDQSKLSELEEAYNKWLKKYHPNHSMLNSH